MKHNDYLWLSIGENCLVDGILKRYKLKPFSTPFSSCRSNIDNVLHMERNNYTGLLDKLHLYETTYLNSKVVRSNLYANCDDIYHSTSSNGFEFTHHDPINKNNHIESFCRKISRMQSIKQKQNVLFLYYHRKTKKSNMSSIRDKLSEIIGLYGASNFDCKVALFYQNKIDNEHERGVKINKVSENIIDFEFFTRDIWEGNNVDVFWGIVDDDLISIMIDNIQLFTSSERKPK